MATTPANLRIARLLFRGDVDSSVNDLSRQLASASDFSLHITNTGFSLHIANHSLPTTEASPRGSPDFSLQPHSSLQSLPSSLVHFSRDFVTPNPVWIGTSSRVNQAIANSTRFQDCAERLQGMRDRGEKVTQNLTYFFYDTKYVPFPAIPEDNPLSSLFSETPFSWYPSYSDVRRRVDEENPVVVALPLHTVLSCRNASASEHTEGGIVEESMEHNIVFDLVIPFNRSVLLPLPSRRLTDSDSISAILKEVSSFVLFEK